MLRHATLVCVACIACLSVLQSPAEAEPKFELLPVLATGSHSFNGSEIILDGGGQRLFLEIRIGGWDPDLDGTPRLKSWQATINSVGYTSGTRGTLAAPIVACSTTADCEAAFSPGSRCWEPGAPPGQCPAGYIYNWNPDYVFYFMAELPAVDISTPDYRYASVLNAPTIVDPGVDKYAGTLVLDVPIDALGTFTIGFFGNPDSDMLDGNGNSVGAITLAPAVVTVLCQNNADCLDSSECTNDVCENDGTCSHNPNHGPAWCCDPADGTKTLINDSNVCTDDSCNPDGTVDHTPVTPGTACGSPSNTECTDPDTCDASGNCADNHALFGTTCGDPTDTGCDNPDTCNGAGICQDNLEIVGFPCGDPSNTQCDDPDTCDGAGVCLTNFEPQGLPCGDPSTSDCDNGDICNGQGACDPNNHADGLACGDDGVECTFDLCATGLCSHPPRPGGTACGSAADTGCDNPDTCDGAGACQLNHEPWGFACGDPYSDECTDPDTCDGFGGCLENHSLAGAPCGDPADTDCTNPDTCDGNGGCQSNHETSGTACGDPTNTDCDNPDTCNATGSCLVNFVPNGTSCNDGLYCNVNEKCTTGACGGGGPRNCGDGIACTTDTCDENTNQCDNTIDSGFCLITGLCRTDGTTNPTNQCEECNPSLDTVDWSFKPPGTPCDDGLYCNVNEVCAAGVCGGGDPRDCDDTFACTGDSCNEAGDTCVYTPNDNLCPDDNLFCNGDEICVVGVGCDHSGSPCGGPCDENSDTCLCDAPIVDAIGGRYLRILPQPPSSGPQGILITADCPGAVGKYVNVPMPYDMDRDGIDDENVASFDNPNAVLEGFRTPLDWGELYVYGLDLVPETTYIVRGDCGSPGTPGLSDPTVVTTPILGDTIGVFTDHWGPPDGSANISDVTAVLELFKGLPSAPPLAQVDHMGTGPSGIQCLMNDLRIDIIDALAALQGFKGLVFESMGCPGPCP